MKNFNLVKSLIEQLKTNAENEFELHRIKVLERDLLEGLPEVKVIDETHQEFNGVIYKMACDGHFNSGSTYSLHRNVWQYYHGAIPKGNYLIHHKDWDKSNNSISNLQLLTKTEHGKIHNPLGQMNGMPNEKEFTCDICGKKFIKLDVGQKSHYCSKRCLEKAKQLRLTKTLICKNCGKEFTARKYDNRTKFCSHKCAQEFNHAKAVEIKKCVVCGKEFEAYKYRKQEACSAECGNKWRTIKNTVVKKCPSCGKEFTTASKKKIYCDECRDKRRAEGRNQSNKLQIRYQQAYEVRSCPICGKKFSVLKQEKKECCSRTCRSRLRAIRESERKKIELTATQISLFK